MVAFAGGIVVVLGVARAGPDGYPSRSLRLRHPIFAVGMLVLVVNSLSPYVGLKTESSFTMFSNLHTEGGRWNHLFIPEAVRIFPYQDDLVRIVASNDRALEASTRNGQRLVRFELERYLRSHPATTATYATTDGRGETIHRAGPGRNPTGPSMTRIVDEIVKFKSVPAPERGGC